MKAVQWRDLLGPNWGWAEGFLTLSVRGAIPLWPHAGLPSDFVARPEGLLSAAREMALFFTQTGASASDLTGLNQLTSEGVMLAFGRLELDYGESATDALATWIHRYFVASKRAQLRAWHSLFYRLLHADNGLRPTSEPVQLPPERYSVVIASIREEFDPARYAERERLCQDAERQFLNRIEQVVLSIDAEVDTRESTYPAVMALCNVIEDESVRVVWERLQKTLLASEIRELSRWAFVEAPTIGIPSEAAMVPSSEASGA